MADKVQDFAEYRIRQIEIAEAKYYESLIATLDKIEKEVVSLAGRTLPTDDLERLYDLKIAVSMQPKIRAILEKEYLAWSDTVVREGFTKQAKRVEKAFKRIGNIPVEFQELTKGDLALVKNLKQQYFTQFKDVSNTFTRKLSEVTYQNVLVGNDFTELEKELRQTINGIYASSDDTEAQKLIDYINRNKYNKSKKAQVDRSIQTLQTKFARDRAGENMKRYASQILNDSLRDFDATLNFNKSRDAGLTFVKYYGDVIPTTRELCRNLVNGVYNKRKGGLFTINEIKDLWQSRSWSGKKSGNPLVVRGGYNCRHQFSYVNPDWYDSKGELII